MESIIIVSYSVLSIITISFIAEVITQFQDYRQGRASLGFMLGEIFFGVMILFDLWTNPEKLVFFTFLLLVMGIFFLLLVAAII